MRVVPLLRCDTPIKALAVAAVLAIGAPLMAADSAKAQTWRQDDPSAIVLPSQPDGSGARSGGNRGGLFRIFRFEPQRQTRLLPQPELEVAPIIDLPPPKDPDAITVVTLGDEFADQLREGLVDRFDGDRLIAAEGASIPGSGMTNLEEFNWNTEALRRLDDYTQIGAIAVAIGYSDRRSLIDGERIYAFGTTAWRDVYRNRVSSFALTLVTEGYPVIFVGLPPMGDPALDEDIRLINQVVEEAVAPTRARFVSVYAGFADLAGNYTRAGPNMAGQVENLRRADGIFFNRAGREKFAHFVERFVPRDGQVGPEPEVSSVVFEGSNLSADGIGPTILMTSGFADPTATLVRDPSEVLPEEPETRARLLQGAAAAPPPGRADSFAWPEGSGS
ncbi:DUF459 domain-containing protein [Ahrensia marina]|uniref:SGNH/GDSL hydrolase family protein n=1 Tax=Ahrensia marina TaxID=1514904 RepID=UPI0035CFE49C